MLEEKMVPLQPALKEWAIAVDALAKGETVLLLRKGGIREQSGQFTVPHRRAVLFPTYEHQQSHLLKPAYQQAVSPVEPGWHPESIVLKAWAEVSHLFQVRDTEKCEALQPFHVWNSQFVSERLQWKPHQPLHVLVLRVYRLAQPVTLAWTADYGECRSWINLLPAIDLKESVAVLSEETFQAQCQTIGSILEK